MNLSKYICLACRSSSWRVFTTYWNCEECGRQYPTTNGVPRLYVEERLGEHDRALRDFFYNGFLGRWYQYVMPFLALPVRPNYWNGWLAYVLSVAVMLGLAGYTFNFLFLVQGWRNPSLFDVIVVLLFLALSIFLLRHRYLFYLFITAIPVKISLRFARFKPAESFPEIHARLIEELQRKPGGLQVLDISTGTCNSLYRHGWMKLKADYTGLDLSETMLMQGMKFMTTQGVAMDFVLGDALELPFDSEVFDVVLNYGALNGYSEPKRALEEMSRVAKPGALLLFLDEQLYKSASWIEKFYFKRVLSSHDVIHQCPVELMPSSLERVTVHQVYQFYYLCTSYKS
jgi:ubiquinone/menaquinone biosynthesis C-methylase UbiE